MGKPVVTSMKVDEDTWKKAKIRAIEEGITLQDLLNQALEEKLSKKESGKK